MLLNDKLSIRPYQVADLDAVIDIFLRSVREVASTDYDEVQVYSWAQAHQRPEDLIRGLARTQRHRSWKPGRRLVRRNTTTPADVP
jgi:hypothetical protein